MTSVVGLADFERAQKKKKKKKTTSPKQLRLGELLVKNKVISREAIIGEVTKAFSGDDTNNDSQLTASELSVSGGSRSTMARFLKGHAKEIDRDGDGTLTQAAGVGNA